MRTTRTMATTSDPRILDALAQAAAARNGIRVRTNNPARLRQLLYEERKKHEAFTCLSLRASPIDDNELWIVKKNVEAAQES